MESVLVDFVYENGYYLSLALVPVVVYFVFFNKRKDDHYYLRKGFFYPVKYLVARREVDRHRQKYRDQRRSLGVELENDAGVPSVVHSNVQRFAGSDQIGNSLILSVALGAERSSEFRLYLRLADGNSYTLPGDKHILNTSLPKEQWKLKGLVMEVLEPYKRLRIAYNGLLKNVGTKRHGTIERVKFNFIFSSAGSPFFIPEDVDASLLTDALVTDVWRDGSWTQNLVDQYGYEQFGAASGLVEGDFDPEGRVLNLATCRSSLRGMDDRLILRRAIRLFVADEYGNLIQLVVKGFRDGCQQMSHGWVYRSDNSQSPIRDVDLRMEDVGATETIPDMLTLHVATSSECYRCVVHLDRSKAVTSTNSLEYFGYECHTVPGECDLNLNQGKVLMEFWYKKQGSDVSVPRRLLHERAEQYSPNVLVLDIKSEQSQVSELTGGKGTSLALLASLESEEYVVPDGCIVTVNAYRLQVESNPDLKASLRLIDDICCGRKDGDLTQACDSAMSIFKGDEISARTRTSIVEYLGRYKGTSWAVRSSAVGEDSEDLSAAGQNETFLGRNTEEEVLGAVSACWASLFSAQSVRYRWRHGAPVLTDMAVVIQEMVPSESAGVLFTWHPTSSDPSRMVVTSNFGLGETVVSGESDPDTFVLSRSWDDRLELTDRHAGAKKKVLRVRGQGIVPEENEDEDRSWSLSEEQVLLLGRIGIELEEAFGSPRDIEWAFSHGKLYLLQSRPITTSHSWTDFELTHEMDSATVTENSVFTVANVKEVVPFGTCVLNQTLVLRAVDVALQICAHEHYDPSSTKGLPTFLHHCFLDVANGIHKNASESVSTSALMMDLAIFGHPVLDDRLNDLIKRRRGIASKLRIGLVSVKVLGYALRNRKWYEDSESEAKRLRVLLDFQGVQSAMEMMARINEGSEGLTRIAVNHSKTTAGSVFYQILMMNILLEGRKELTTELSADFAIVLSSCEEVVSAEIPVYVARIAEAIRAVEGGEGFCEVPASDGVDWLKENCPEGYRLLDEFLERHGHRSSFEFDLMEKSWSDEPSSMISMIQLNVKHGRDYVKHKLSVDEIVSRITSVQNPRTKSVIKFIMKRMRTAVAIREKTKCEMIRVVHFLRLACRHLGGEMVKLGLLPSADLMYHLTSYELGQLLSKRNPSLVTKALRRQRLFPKLRRLNFPEVIYGRPEPIDGSREEFEAGGDVVKGTPASAGLAKGRACVLNSLEEIGQLRKGDILITYSTDISWSPYFPMISGIVTELGGLVSHGAVVAREYGLPSVVGVKAARRYFSTGDTIFIDGSKGEIGKVLEK